MARRQSNPVATIQVVCLVTAFVAGAVMSNARPRRRHAKKKTSYTWNEARARKAIYELLQNGERDRAFVAAEAASRLFGQHPSGAVVTFPPGPRSPFGVETIWGRMVRLVDKVFEEERVLEGQEARDLAWVIHDPLDEGYPWEEPSLHVGNYPSPGMFFDAGSPTQVGQNLDADHDLDKVVRRSLQTGLSMANMDPRLATGTSKTSKRLRREMRQLIMESKFNDGLYGQTDLVKAGGDPEEPASYYVLGEKGRGLNWLPYHADNLVLIDQGKAPMRTTMLDGERMPQHHQADAHMLLWIPAIDLALLSDQVPKVEPYVWSDGTSTKEPPPVVQKLGTIGRVMKIPKGARC